MQGHQDVSERQQKSPRAHSLFVLTWLVVGLLLVTFTYPSVDMRDRLLTIAAILGVVVYGQVTNATGRISLLVLVPCLVVWLARETWHVAFIWLLTGIIFDLSEGNERRLGQGTYVFSCWTLLLALEQHSTSWGAVRWLSYMSSELVFGLGSASTTPHVHLGPAHLQIPAILWLVLLACFVAANGRMAILSRIAWIVSLVALALASARFGLTIIVASVFSFLLVSHMEPQVAIRKWGGYAIGAIAALAALLLVSLDIPSTKQDRLTRRLTFMTDGMGSFLMPDGIVPAIAPLNADFGAVPQVLTRYGWRVTTAQWPLSQSQLLETDVLLVANPLYSPTGAELSLIKDYVESGGGLVIIGDHTNIFGTMTPLNRLLSFTDIRFNYDSAVPGEANQFWANALRSSHRPPFLGVDNSELQISIGASLSVSDPAVTVVQGDIGFADIGGEPREPVGVLGNLQPGPGEDRGALPLVAEQQIGLGRVLVFGDTSGFQNASLTQNHGFINRVLESIADQRFVESPGLRSLLPIAIASLTLLAVAIRMPLALAVLGAFLFQSVAFGLLSTKESPAPSWEGALVFSGAYPSRYPDVRKDNVMFTALETLSRTGQAPLVARELTAELLQNAKTVILPPISRRISEHDAERLFNAVENGLNIICVAGGAEAESYEPLLERFDLKVGTTYLGAAPESRLIQASPAAQSSGTVAPASTGITFQNAHAIQASPTAKTLVECWGESIVASVALGAGRFTWISDSKFLLDKNLGTGQIRNVQTNTFLLQLASSSGSEDPFGPP